MQTIDDALDKLQTSEYRRRFHLRPNDIVYIQHIGLDTIRRHAEKSVRTRLEPAESDQDRRQTPTSGDPVFVAQHACACCCRACLEEWYKVPRNTALSSVQQQKIVELIMAWIRREIARNPNAEYEYSDSESWFYS